MKTSKKVLGVVLTLIMLVNVFAVSVFAAYPDDAAVALIVKTDKASYAAGETVVLTVSTKATAEIGGMRIGGQYELGYNSAALEPFDATNTKLEGQGFAADAHFATSYNPDYSQAVFNDKAGSAPTDGKGWDSVILYCIADDGATAKDCADAEATLFTIKMKIPAGAADGTYTIGFNQYGYEENYSAYATSATEDRYGNDGSSYGKEYLYDFGVAEFTVGEGGSTGPVEPTVKVNNLSTQVQWANKDAGLMNLGFRGQIADGYNAETDKDGTTGVNGGANLAKLTEVGFYLNNTKYQAYTIYNFVDGGYFYRVVVGNVSYDSETEFSAQAYVVIDGTEYKADDATTITTTGKAQYERAKDAMGAK